MKGNSKQTSPRVAKIASKEMRSKSTPPKQKSVAASAVSQARGKSKKKK